MQYRLWTLFVAIFLVALATIVIKQYLMAPSQIESQYELVDGSSLGGHFLERRDLKTGKLLERTARNPQTDARNQLLEELKNAG